MVFVLGQSDPPTGKTWTCQNATADKACGHKNSPSFRVCRNCGEDRPTLGTDDTKVCTRCSQLLPIADFYFVSKKLGTRRGQCKRCMSDIKAMQKDPNWKPTCCRCGVEMDRFGPGRRMCRACFDAQYDAEAPRPNGAHHLRLSPCTGCGEKRLREDHVYGTSLCAICRSVSQSRRKRLRTFNMSARDYITLLEAQHYCCHICHRPFNKTRIPNVDHQHKEPPIVRGLVCSGCNSMLGMARDEAARLRSAAHYLEFPPAQDVFPGLVAKPEANRPGDWRPMTRVRAEAA